MSVRPARRWFPVFLIVLGVVFCTGCPGLVLYWLLPDTTTTRELASPKAAPEEALVDDLLADKKRLPFEPDLVSPGLVAGWEVNNSAAVFRLHVAPVDEGTEAGLLVLHPSYAAAWAAGGCFPQRALLPSVNLIDGQAKQFDDGLYAALDLACFAGRCGKVPGAVELVRRLYRHVGPGHAGAPYLAAALELAGEPVAVDDGTEKERLLRDFSAQELLARPAAFYTWSEELGRCFRFFRFFRFLLSVPLPASLRGELPTPELRRDRDLLVAFYARLTNPPHPGRSDGLLPFSTSRENELFERVFPDGVPPDAHLMNELVRAVRSGRVSLQPRPSSGWYDYQLHALETFLLPERGEERDKLLLTREYKKRMMEAFKALVTKRRETHYRQLPIGCGGSLKMVRLPPDVTPRLRLEPCPTYYLRTARAYAFLADFLQTAVGPEALAGLRGLRQGGDRGRPLGEELLEQRDRFYGFYLLSLEDLGQRPAFLKGEPVERERCRALAERWLEGVAEHADLACDTRVSVPVYYDPQRNVTRVWATLGVRLAKLDVSYEIGPRVRQPGSESWQAPGRTGTAHYLIPVDTFAEVEMKGQRALTREELRAVCDRAKTKEAIVAELRSLPARRRWWLLALGGAGVAGAAVAGWLLARRRRKR
jgi:hypothetical protein